MRIQPGRIFTDRDLDILCRKVFTAKELEELKGKVLTDKELEDIKGKLFGVLDKDESILDKNAMAIPKVKSKRIYTEEEVIKGFNTGEVPKSIIPIPERDTTAGWGIKKRKRYTTLIRSKVLINSAIRCVNEFKGDLDAMDTFDKGGAL